MKKQLLYVLAVCSLLLAGQNAYGYTYTLQNNGNEAVTLWVRLSRFLGDDMFAHVTVLPGTSGGVDAHTGWCTGGSSSLGNNNVKYSFWLQKPNTPMTTNPYDAQLGGQLDSWHCGDIHLTAYNYSGPTSGGGYSYGGLWGLRVD